MNDEFIQHICDELKSVGLCKKDLETLLLVVENMLFVDFLLFVSNTESIDTKRLMNIELKYKTALCYEKGYKANDLIMIKNDTIGMYEKNNLERNNQIVINFYNSNNNKE